MTAERAVVLICTGIRKRHTPAVLASLVVRDGKVVDLRAAGRETLRQGLLANMQDTPLPSFDRQCRQCPHNPRAGAERILWIVTTALDGFPGQRRVTLDVSREALHLF